jgi:choline monooxygenase
MLNGRGNTNAIVCPLHRWTYDLQGTLLGAPHFDEQPCLNLGKTPLADWRGLLFEGPRDVAADLAGVGLASELNFDGYLLDHVEVHECAYNWKTFIEVYSRTTTLRHSIPAWAASSRARDLDWHFADRFSVPNRRHSRRAEQAGLARLPAGTSRSCVSAGVGCTPRRDLLTYYPNVMVEWYPYVLVSTLVRRAAAPPMVEFYYPEEITLFEREFVEAERAAYMETCLEDDEIALRMDAGRRALMERGQSEVGPYQSPMEDGMQHFHEFYRREMAAIFDPADGRAAEVRLMT